jgi:hypothetical protein
MRDEHLRTEFSGLFERAERRVDRAAILVTLVSPPPGGRQRHFVDRVSAQIRIDK